MKRNIFIIMMVVVCAALVSAENTVSQTHVAGKIVGTGCVGECGAATAKVEYTVDAKCKILMLARTFEKSLCGNTGVYAFLFKNGKEAANGHITENGASIQTEAAPGDKIVVYVMTYPLFNEIVCIRQGDLKFHLIKQDLVKKKASLPIHIVVDYSDMEEPVVVTSYVPDSRNWIKFKKRKK